MRTTLLKTFTFLIPAALMLTACPSPPSSGDGDRKAYVDEWTLEYQGTIEGLNRLFIGGRVYNENYTNRGNIEVRYVEGVNGLQIEMQRFTIAESDEEAAAEFDKMSYWAYTFSTPEPPSDANAL